MITRLAFVLFVSVPLWAGAAPRISPFTVAPETKSATSDPSATRTRTLNLDAAALDALDAQWARERRASVEIAFFPDVVVTMDIVRVEQPRAGVTEYHATLADEPGALAMLVKSDGVLSAEAMRGNKRYRVLYRGASGYQASEEASMRVARHMTMTPPPRRSALPKKSPPGVAAKAVTATPKDVEDGSIIDVLFVYTPAAATEVGGDAAMSTLIDSTLAATNVVFTNSDTQTRLRLVGKGQLTGASEIRYNLVSGNPQPRNVGELLFMMMDSQFTTGPNAFRIAHDWRNTYGADIIVLVTSSASTTAGACGVALQMAEESPTYADYAMTSVSLTCFNWNGVAHEVGHVLGIGHDPDGSTTEVGGQTIDYAFGYADPVNKVQDVMSYGTGCTGCVSRPRYSNPSVMVDSQAFPGTPVPIGSTHADAARVIRQTRHTTANFRTYPRSNIGFVVSQVTAREDAGSVQLTIARTGGSPLDPSSVSYRTVDGGARAGRDYTATSGSFSWNDGETGGRTFTIPLLNNVVNGGRRRFTVVLENMVNGTPVNAVATVAIDDVAADTFPPNCQMPAGWFTPAGAQTGFAVDSSGEAGEGHCALKSQAIADGERAEIAYTGVFKAGTVSFRRRVHSEAGWDFFRFYIDGVEQGPTCALGDNACAGAAAAGATASGSGSDSASGATDWSEPGLLRYAISAGTHTITFRYEKDAGCCGQGADAAWIDDVVLPLADTLSVAVTGDGRITSEPAAIDCGATCAAPWVANTPVLLTATANAGASFTNWSNCPSAVGNQCFTLVGAALSVTANFGSASAPGAPTISGIVPGNSQLTLSFSPPASNGGSAITQYTATCNPGSITASGSASPIVVTGLANGTSYTCTVAATNAIGTGAASASSASVTPQATQTITFGSAPTITVGGTGSISATGGASGNAVTFTSQTTSICTVSGVNGATVTGVAVGTCTIAANQPGNASHTAAPQVTQSLSVTLPTFTVTPSVVSGGSNGSISPSVAQTVTSGATSAFTVTPNSGYSASVGGTCGGSLVGTTYTTSAVVANCTVEASFRLLVALSSVVSRKTHGSAGVFEIAINPATAITGNVDVDPRTIGSGHTIVFTYNQTIASVSGVTATDSAGNPIGAANAVVNGLNANEVIVTLTGVPDVSRILVSLSGVTGSIAGTTTSSAAMGFLVGDVNNSRSVNASDVTTVKSTVGQTTDATNFRRDVNASGGINASDLTTVKTRTGGSI